MPIDLPPAIYIALRVSRLNLGMTAHAYDAETRAWYLGERDAMVKVFNISLEPPTSPNGYLSGSNISGKVVVVNDQAKNYKQIGVSFVGSGKVEWTVGNGEESETHKAKEEYLCESEIVWGGVLGEGQSGTLSAGRHEFPFTFYIPESCPSSYETDGGSSRLDVWIRYVLTARISTKGALKADHTAEKRITVVQEFIQQTNSEPIRRENLGSEGCLCCVSGPVALTAELPYSSFMVGERIPLSISVENTTTHDLRVEAKLVKRLRLKAQSHEFKRASQSVARECKEPFRSRTGTKWNPQMLLVPDGHATLETPGGMIVVSYEVRVHLGLRYGQTLEVSIPVMIENVTSSDHVTCQGFASGVTMTDHGKLR